MDHLVKVPPTSERNVCLVGKMFGEYICDEVGTVWNCYVCPIHLEKDVEMLWNPTIEPVAEDETFS